MSDNMIVEFKRVELMDIITKISVRTNESRVMFTPIVLVKQGNKLVANQIDQTHIAFMSAEITPESITGGVDGQKFALNPNKTIALLKSDNSEKVQIKVTSKNMEVRTKNGKYELMLEEFEEKDVHPARTTPEKYEFAYVAVASDIQQVLKQGKDFRLDKFLFQIRNKKLEISAGDMTKDMIKISRKIPGGLDKEPTRDTRCLYNERIGLMVDQLSGEIALRFEFDQAILISSESEKLKVTFMLAPMVMTPDDGKPDVIVPPPMADTPETIREEEKDEVKDW